MEYLMLGLATNQMQLQTRSEVQQHNQMPGLTYLKAHSCRQTSIQAEDLLAPQNSLSQYLLGEAQDEVVEMQGVETLGGIRLQQYQRESADHH
jgi:hypothetical protein